MSVTTAVPDVWEVTLEATRFEDYHAREYTRVVYEYADGHQAVRISDVQEPNSFVGWRYLVRATGDTDERLGVVEDLETAKERATAFMAAYDPRED